jgi:exonuclease SbcD
MDSEIHTVGNIDQINADLLEPFDYAALGHIHKPMKVGSEFYRYSGTPLACSVSEAGQEKGIIKVTLGQKGDIGTEVLPLKPLRQVRVIKGTLAEVLTHSCEDYVTVILEDKVDLDVFDIQDRLRNAFTNLLEIRRETLRKADYKTRFEPERVLDPFELCNSFLKDLDPEEQNLLRDVINSIQEKTF